MKLNQLKMLAAVPNEDADIVDAYSALEALPGLLMVCEAYKDLLVAYAELDASRFGATVDGSAIRGKAEKKLEELLG